MQTYFSSFFSCRNHENISTPDIKYSYNPSSWMHFAYKAKEIGKEAMCNTLTHLAIRIFQIGIENTNSAHIIAGTIGTISGAYWIIKSKIPLDIFNSCTKPKIQESSDEQRDVFSTCRQIKKGTCFALGMVSLTFGLYYLYIGIVESINQEEENNFSSHSNLMDYHPPLIQSQTEPKRDFNLLEAFAKIKECPASNQILEAVKKEGLITLMPIPVKHLPHELYKGSWDVNNRIIRVSEAIEGREKISVLLFELLNASKTKHIMAIDNIASKGKLSSEAYTKRIEKIEHESRIAFSHIYESCITTNGWDPSFNRFDGLLGDFEQLWNTQIKNSLHAHWIKQNWFSQFKQIFCQKHPSSADCLVSKEL